MATRCLNASYAHCTNPPKKSIQVLLTKGQPLVPDDILNFGNRKFYKVNYAVLRMVNADKGGTDGREEAITNCNKLLTEAMS